MEKVQRQFPAAAIHLSEQRDLNPRPTAPKAAALAKLRYAPIMSVTVAKDEDLFHHFFMIN